MLMNYTVKNYGVFKNKAILSMIPEDISDWYNPNEEDYEVNFKNGIKVRNSALIIGDNGSGKTTLIRSLEYFQQLMLSNKPLKINKKTVNLDNRHLYPDTTQEFELEVVVLVKEKPCVYRFGLELDGNGIVKESLGCRISMDGYEDKLYLFEREIGLYLNPNYFLNTKCVSEVVRKFPSGTILNRVAMFCPEKIVPFIKWVENSLVIKYRPTPNMLVTQEANAQTLSILRSKGFLDLFQLVDNSICRVDVDEKEPYKATNIIREGENLEEYSISLAEESDGVREFFYWSEQLMGILKQDKTLVIDDLDCMMDSVLTSRLIAYINYSKHRGQFIFSTHDSVQLDLGNFCPEQMYIVSKRNGFRSSELYTVSDMDLNYNDVENLTESYLRSFLR